MAASSGLLQQKNIVFQELQARKKSLSSAGWNYFTTKRSLGEQKTELNYFKLKYLILTFTKEFLTQPF